MSYEFPNGSRGRAQGSGWLRARNGGSRVRSPRSRARLPFSVIAAIYLILSTSVAAAAVKVIHSHSQSQSVGIAGVTPGAAKYLVLIVLDGATPSYFGMTSLPHVDALRNAGTQFTNAFDGILEAETPSGHTTIATGSTPVKDGILGFDWAQNDSDYSIFSPTVVDQGAMTQIMQEQHVPTIAGLYKAKYPHTTAVALSGHKYYAADPLGGPNADAIMYYQGSPQGQYVPVAVPGHVPPSGVLTTPGLIFPSSAHVPDGEEDHLATLLDLATFAHMHQRITLINYPEFDYPLGHVDGGPANPAKVIIDMKAFDKDLGSIEDTYRKAGILSKTLFVITADHGMEPTTRFIPETVVTNAVSKAGATAPAISYSTGCYIWLTDGTKAQTVADNIWNSKDPGVQSVYYLTGGSKPAYVEAGGALASPAVDQANQYLLQTLMNGHEPTIVAIAKTGQTFQNSTTGWKADHGGPEWQSEHMPLIFSGPGIQRGLVTNQPAQLEDIAPTLLTDMGVKPTGMQGNVLTEALSNSTTAAQKSRQAEIRLTTPVVNALIAQDSYDQHH